MDNGKIWAPILVLGLILGGVFVFSYFEKVDKANANFHYAKLFLEQSNESLTTRQQIIEARGRVSSQNEAMLQKLKLAQAKLQAAEKKQSDADTKQRLIEGDLKYLVKSMPSTVQKVRDGAMGKEYPELKLLNGKVLKGAKMRKVEDLSISFIHSEGIGSIPAEDLPTEMLAQFDVGDNSIVKRLNKLEQALVDKIPAPTINVETATTAQPVPQSSFGSMSEKDAAKLKELKFKLTDYESKLKAANQIEQGWSKQVTAYTVQIERNQQRGVPTTKLREEQQKISALAAQALSQVNFLDAERRKTQTAIDLLSGH